MVGKQERRYQRMITVVLALISLIMVIPLVLLVVASFTSNVQQQFLHTQWKFYLPPVPLAPLILFLSYLQAAKFLPHDGEEVFLHLSI